MPDRTLPTTGDADTAANGPLRHGRFEDFYALFVGTTLLTLECSF